MKLGEILSGNISEYKSDHLKLITFLKFMVACCITHNNFLCSGLELVDQFDNLTKTLTPSCVNHIKVEAEGLDKSAITFKWQVGPEPCAFKTKVDSNIS